LKKETDTEIGKISVKKTMPIKRKKRKKWQTKE
jgi:hypothetical protein